MEKYVVNVDLANELNENGWKRKTAYYWYKLECGWDLGDTIHDNPHEEWGDIPAPTSDELLEVLPYRIAKDSRDYYLTILPQPIDHEIIVNYEAKDKPTLLGHPYICEEKLSDALAKMWLYLKKNNLLDGK